MRHLRREGLRLEVIRLLSHVVGRRCGLCRLLGLGLRLHEVLSRGHRCRLGFLLELAPRDKDIRVPQLVRVVDQHKLLRLDLFKVVLRGPGTLWRSSEGLCFHSA